MSRTPTASRRRSAVQALRASSRTPPSARARSSPGAPTAGGNLADEYSVAVDGVADAHAVVGAVGVDDLAVLDELGRDVLDDAARDREADSGRGAAELRIGDGERRDADHPACEVDERAAAVARVDRSARLDRIRQRGAVGFA